jgi:hypothetical protein
MIVSNPDLTHRNKVEISQENYKVVYEIDLATIRFQGSLRLNNQDEDYERITNLLDQLIELEPPTVTLNLQELNFLNSLGINMLSKFVITVRKKRFIKVLVQGNTETPWQGKSLKNLQRLMPNLDLQMQ